MGQFVGEGTARTQVLTAPAPEHVAVATPADRVGAEPGRAGGPAAEPPAATRARTSGAAVRAARVPFQERRRVVAAPDLGVPRLSGPAADLVERCGDEVLFLHGRRASRTGRGRLDLLAVTATGVHLVAFVAVPVTPPARGRLLARRRVAVPDLTGVGAELDRQVLAASVALGSSPMPVPVRGLVCLPAGTRTPHRTPGTHPVLDLPAAVARLTTPGRLGPEQRRAVRDALAHELPPA
jgi:hypothetical protein